MVYELAELVVDVAKGFVEVVSAVSAALNFYSVSKVEYLRKVRIKPMGYIDLRPKEVETMIRNYFGDINLRRAMELETRGRAPVTASEIARQYDIPEEKLATMRKEIYDIINT
jgi:hypothetical protein